ncbi:MAG: glycosyltransferase family 4 protein [Patescibacteria group bacterium]
MKFIYCAPRYHTNLHFQIKVLRDHGHEVHFLSLYRGGSEYYDALEPDILGYSGLFLFLNRFYNPPGGRLTKNSFELKYGFPPLFKLFRYFFQIKPDVVVIKNIESVYSVFTTIFARLFGARVVFLIQIPKFRSKLRSESVHWVGKIFSAIVLTPVWGDSQFPNDNHNLFYLPFSYPLAVDKRELAPGGTFRLMCVGKFQERKGQLVLLKALSCLVARYPLKLTLVGQTDESKYYNQLLAYIRTNKLEELVTIKQDLPWEEVQSEYLRHDIFILPSWLESAAYSPLEAMAHGLAVITSDDNGTKNYIVEGENGYHFRVGDGVELAQKIEAIVQNSGTLTRMSQRSLEEVRNKYDPEQFYKQFRKVLGLS